MGRINEIVFFLTLVAEKLVHMEKGKGRAGSCIIEVDELVDLMIRTKDLFLELISYYGITIQELNLRGDEAGLSLVVNVRALSTSLGLVCKAIMTGQDRDQLVVMSGSVYAVILGIEEGLKQFRR